MLLAHGLFILVRRVFKRPSEWRSASDPALYAGPFAVAESTVLAHQARGAEIFAWHLIRFLGALALLGLWITTLLQGCTQKAHLGIFNKDVAIAFVATHAYTSILALWALISRADKARYLSVHVAPILLASWLVFFYRDIWPLGTFNSVPLDIPLDRFFWPKFIILTLIGVVTPLLIPTPYIPFDPNNPSEEPAPEQTASLLSFLLFSFLDSLVWAGYRTKHLAYDRLPPLADYDRASWLKQRAFAHLDPFLIGKRRHVIWGLISVFKTEFSVLVISLVVRTVTSFFAPIGVNRLLAYIESSGVGATVRPWVWIILIVIGPLVGSIALQVRRPSGDAGPVLTATQVYIFISTRMLVRVESILTELVFEHSLRIRVKEETSNPISLPSTPNEATTTAESDEELDSSSGSTTAAGSEPPTATAKPQVKGKEPLHPSRIASNASVSKPAVKEKSKESNLIGKINNLATSDLSNVTGASARS